MVSHRVARNIWLLLSVLSFAIIIVRTVGLFSGTADFEQFITVVIIFFFCFKYYLACRNKARTKHSVS